MILLKEAIKALISKELSKSHRDLVIFLIVNNKMGPVNDHTEYKHRKALKLAVDYLTRLSNFKETISVSWDMLPNSHPCPAPQTHTPPHYPSASGWAGV